MFAYGIVAYRRCQKIGRHQWCSLMQQLVKGVLAIRAGLSPDDRPGLVGEMLTVPSNRFSVTLHVALLKVRRKPMHILIVWQDHFGLCSKEVAVPDAYERQDNRDVSFERLRAEMAVHVERTLEKFSEVVVTDKTGDGQADSGPESVTPADPIPENEHILLIDAEGADLFHIG